jgi:hypothetical protein
MIVPGGLDPDPDQSHRPPVADRLDPPHQLGHPRLGQRELEPTHQQLAGEVTHQRHR